MVIFHLLLTDKAITKLLTLKKTKEQKWTNETKHRVFVNTNQVKYGMDELLWVSTLFE